MYFFSDASAQKNNYFTKLLASGEKDINENKYADALRKGKMVYEEAVLMEDTLLQGESSLLIGRAFQKSERYLSSLEYLFTALKVFDKSPERKYEIYYIIGNLFYQWGRYKIAMDYYGQAGIVDLSPGQKNQLNEAMGDTYLRLNQPANALPFYDSALALTPSNDFNHQFRLLEKKANVYLTLKNYTKALSVSFHQLKIISHTNNSEKVPVLFNNIGYLYNHKNDLDSALVYFKKARDESLVRNQIDSIYIKLINIGAIYSIKGEIDSSLMVFHEALDIVKSDPDKIKEAMVRNYLAAVLVKRKQYGPALHQNNLAISFARKAGNSKLLADYYYKRSKLFETRGNIKEKHKYDALFRHLKDSLNLVSEFQKGHKMTMDSLANVEERQLQMELLHKENQFLNQKALDLLTRQHSRELVLERIAVDNEKLKKDQVQRLWLLTQKELDNEKKERDIISLQKEKSEQKLKVQETIAKLSRAEKESLKKELELSKSRQVLLRVILGLSAGIVLLIFMVFILLYKRLRQNIHETQEKLTLVENMQKLLRSQMNPHFLFNSLNSIQGFITSNDMKNACSYLARYANLMRSILQNSAKEKVSLHEELSALRSYIELEQMRHDHLFSYCIESNNLEKDMIDIPPMLIQPFVENAILHGLRHSTQPGHLHISLYNSDNYLNCEIKDNGIGRMASKKINGYKEKGHNPLGMSLTKERFQLLNRKENAKMNVQIEDLYCPEGSSLGTKVLLKIALYE